MNGNSQIVMVVDQTGTATFEVAGRGPPGASTGSAAWSNLCPKCGNDNMCAATGPFNGSFCNAQPITYEKVNCPGGGEEMAQIQES